MWSKPFWPWGLGIFEAVVIGFEIGRGYRQFSVVPGLVAGAFREARDAAGGVSNCLSLGSREKTRLSVPTG
jgi:hypothetical protein